MAEWDIGGESFGETRCRVVARAYLATRADLESQVSIKTAADGRQLEATLAASIAAAFKAAGLDPDRPHLEPGGSDQHAG